MVVSACVIEGVKRGARWAARGRRRLVWPAIIALLLAAPARRARAQAEEAEAQIRQGLELRRQGNDARALPFFEKAYHLARNPRTAGQLGMAEMALGYWVEAERYLDEALAAMDHPWVAHNKATLEDARTRLRRMIGELTITGEPAGAEVLINGRPSGRLPLPGPLRLGKGTVEVELRAPGYPTATKSVMVPGGGTESVSLVLARAEDHPAEVGAAAQPDRAQASAVVTARPADVEPKSEGSAMRPIAWTLGGIGVAGVAFGVFETVAMAGKQNDFNNHTTAGRVDCTTSALTDTCRQLQDAYTHARNLAIVGYAVGGALVVTSAVLLAVAPTAPEKRAALACAPALGTGGTTGVSCLLRF
jgi:hypothetical protein